MQLKFLSGCAKLHAGGPLVRANGGVRRLQKMLGALGFKWRTLCLLESLRGCGHGSRSGHNHCQPQGCKSGRDLAGLVDADNSKRA